MGFRDVCVLCVCASGLWYVDVCVGVCVVVLRKCVYMCVDVSVWVECVYNVHALCPSGGV